MKNLESWKNHWCNPKVSKTKTARKLPSDANDIPVLPVLLAPVPDLLLRFRDYEYSKLMTRSCPRTLQVAWKVSWEGMTTINPTVHPVN